MSPGYAISSDSRSRPIDVRYLCATNADLPLLVERGQFRADLFDRLNVLVIRLPALAESRGSIVAMAERFLAEALQECGRPWLPQFDRESSDALLAHGWPGNLRELKSVCRRIATRLECERAVQLQDLDDFPDGSGVTASAPVPSTVLARVHDVLRAVNGNKSIAAHRLGMSRQQLYRVLERAWSAAQHAKAISESDPTVRTALSARTESDTAPNT